MPRRSETIRGMQLPGELDERCRAGAPGKQTFGAKTAAQRARGGEVTAGGVPAGGEQPSFWVVLGSIDKFDDGVAEDLGGSSIGSAPTVSVTGCELVLTCVRVIVTMRVSCIP